MKVFRGAFMQPMLSFLARVLHRLIAMTEQSDTVRGIKITSSASSVSTIGSWRYQPCIRVDVATANLDVATLEVDEEIRENKKY